jgi:DNA-binding CsgD family transcriptional regulator
MLLALEEPTVSAGRIVDSPYCIGRAAELERARELVHDAALGAGSALIWLGEPGSGKSRLLRECAPTKASATIASIHCGASATFAPAAAAQLAAALHVAKRSHKSRRSPTVLSALAARAKRRPVLILVDDVHLADTKELALIEALCLMARHYRLAVIGTAAADFAWYPAGVERRRLAPLDDAAIELLVRSLAGAHALDGDALRAIVQTAQGNPRFAIELVGRATQPDGTSPLVPDSARAAVAALRATLSRSHFDILAACSVIGETFCSDWLAEITERSVAEVADALQNFTDLGALVEVRSAPGWLAFRQIAVRNALYASIVLLKRRVVHRRIVDLLSRVADGDLRRDAMLAGHAAAIDDSERAAAAFARAGDRLRDDGAFAAAGEMYAHAAAHSPSGQADWQAFQQSAMFCNAKIGEWKRLASTATSTLAELDSQRDAQMVEATLKHLFFAQLNDGNPVAAEQTATRIATLGLPNSENDGRSSRLVLAYGLCYRGHVAEAARLLATVDPEHLGDREVQLRYLIAKAEVGALVTPLQSTLELIDAAAEIALSIQGVTLCYGVGAEIASRYGDLAAAQTYVAKAESLAIDDASVINTLRNVKGRTRIAFLHGDLAEVSGLVRENIGRLESGRTNEAFYAGVAVGVGMRIGDLALGDAFFDPQLLDDSAAARDVESCGWLLSGFAEVMQVRGTSKTLRAILQGCIDERLIDPYTAIQLAATRFGSIECAERAVEQVVEYFDGAVAPSAAGHVALCKATLLRRHGRQIAAAEFAAEAATRFRTIGWRLYEAMALELAGNAGAAARVYRECGASSDAARVAAAETRKRKYAPFGACLSPREREVARLVAAQRSNREIARALEISVRTVDHHVEAAFSKLGIRARWQLSARLAEQPTKVLDP